MTGIGLRVREGRDPVGGLPALQGDGQPGEQVSAGLGLLPVVPRQQGGRQLPDLG